MNDDVSGTRQGSLADCEPGLMKEWDWEKNQQFDPEKLSRSSGKKVWWVCCKGHSWQAGICNRTKEHGTGCPFCTGRRADPGKTDLKTLYPALMEEWNWERNKVDPSGLLPRSNKRVWWKCDKGHSWEAPVCRRTKGTGCPYCSGRLAITGKNDLATVNPELSRQFHPDKNDGADPSLLLPYSNRKLWWLCEKGHEWRTSVAERSSGKGCPYCSGHKSIPGERDLTTLCPELAREWDHDKNLPLKVQDILPNSFKIVWWKCGNGHSWRARVQSRYFGENCPYCSGRFAIPGKTDIKTLYPELMEEWEDLRNDPVKPEDITPSSKRKVWWKCRNGHSWQSSACVRTIKGGGCPFCGGNIPARTRLIEL